MQAFIGTSAITNLAPEPAQVLAKATLRAGKALGLSGITLGKVLGLSESSVSRLSNARRPLDPASKEGELALLLVRLFRSIDALVGHNSTQRQAWMDGYNHALNGAPKDLILTTEGLVRCVNYADGMRARL